GGPPRRSRSAAVRPEPARRSCRTRRAREPRVRAARETGGRSSAEPSPSLLEEREERRQVGPVGAQLEAADPEAAGELGELAALGRPPFPLRASEAPAVDQSDAAGRGAPPRP